MMNGFLFPYVIVVDDLTPVKFLGLQVGLYIALSSAHAKNRAGYQASLCVANVVNCSVSLTPSQNTAWASTHTHYIVTSHSLVPRPPPFFVLRFSFSIIHGSGRARKTGKAWEHLSRE